MGRVVLAGLLAVCVLAGRVVAQAPALAPGREVEVTGPLIGMTLLAASEATFEARKSGSGGLRPGRDLFAVTPGSSARVLAAKRDRVQIKMIGGNWPDREGWIAADQVRAKPTPEQLVGNIRGGLALGRRREVYAELHRVGMLATYEAEWRFPLKELPDDEADSERYQAAHTAAHDAANRKGRAELVRRFKVEGKTLDAIDAEGSAARWPLPEVANPFKGRPAPRRSGR